MVPVRLLEHARFRLCDPQTQSGVGQGEGEPGQVLRPAQPQAGSEEGRGGTGEGEVSFVMELKIDDLLDWIWHEMKLPELKPKQSSAVEDSELVREGWDRHGARSRPSPEYYSLPRRPVLDPAGRWCANLRRPHPLQPNPRLQAAYL